MSKETRNKQNFFPFVVKMVGEWGGVWNKFAPQRKKEDKGCLN